MYLPDYSTSKMPRADQRPHGPQREYCVICCRGLPWV